MEHSGWCLLKEDYRVPTSSYIGKGYLETFALTTADHLYYTIQLYNICDVMIYVDPQTSVLTFDESASY